MTIATMWFYEERQNYGVWLSAYYGHKMSRKEATERMEQRKARCPCAVLRLVCEIKKTRSYRERNSP